MFLNVECAQEKGLNWDKANLSRQTLTHFTTCGAFPQNVLFCIVRFMQSPEPDTRRCYEMSISYPNIMNYKSNFLLRMLHSNTIYAKIPVVKFYGMFSTI